jgi:hypothetical protein
MASYFRGGLIQKYLSGHIGIAFGRSECSARESIQDGFILHVGHHFFEFISKRCDIGLRENRFDNEKPSMLWEIVEMPNMEKMPSPPL